MDSKNEQVRKIFLDTQSWFREATGVMKNAEVLPALFSFFLDVHFTHPSQNPATKRYVHIGQICNLENFTLALRCGGH